MGREGERGWKGRVRGGKRQGKGNGEEGGKEGDPVCILTIFLSITYDISDVVTIAADAVAVA